MHTPDMSAPGHAYPSHTQADAAGLAAPALAGAQDSERARPTLLPARSRAANYGPMPGASITQAAEILAGELPCRTWPYLPQAADSDDADLRHELPGEHPLAARSLLARTLGLLEGIGVDAGPRGFVVRSGATALSARLRRAAARATDLIEAQWAGSWGRGAVAPAAAAPAEPAGSAAAGAGGAVGGVDVAGAGEEIPQLIIPLLGPATLSYRVELAGGMPAITDAGARRDLGAALVELAGRAVAAAEDRFHVPAAILIVDPAATAAVRGTLPGVTDFDTIRPIGRDHMAAAWQRIHTAAARAHTLAPAMAGTPGALLTGITDPDTWELATRAHLAGLWVPAAAVHGTRALDGIAAAADHGLRIGLGITQPGDHIDDDHAIPRERAIHLARITDEMQLGRGWLTSSVDVLPGGPLGETTVLDAAHQLGCARRIADMLVRDAGDL
ncbi:hypothetical protein C1Y63_09770 [Corynebacterium sp. 13CS0277]|uniref:hypothetical protein n=1 Tax=Corynebacterium sp. 13CS0277 TaxID=2071994 RepID=UPI000D0311AB|nr:hypothetical protein [Corynebacterium sp. 13CS0277]PRQ10738.1 hypothetical protein C1Y63_09770 [Corynebacterium sp. 13CS0277]